MRYNIRMHLHGSLCQLPLDHQYYTGAWIYRVLQSASPRYAGLLHDNGDNPGGRAYRYFNYSPLQFRKASIDNMQRLIEIKDPVVQLQVGFHRDKTAGIFLRGLQQQNLVYIGNGRHGIRLQIESIRELNLPPARFRIRWLTLSPVVISQSNPAGKYSRYLSPDDKNYAAMICSNLLRRAGAEKENIPLNFKAHVSGRPRLVTIKAGSNQQSRIKGYQYSFTLSAPPHIQQLLWNCGLGEKNSTGFGWCEIQNANIR